MKDVLSLLRWAAQPAPPLAGFRIAQLRARHRPGQRAAPARRHGAGRRPAPGAGWRSSRRRRPQRDWRALRGAACDALRIGSRLAGDAECALHAGTCRNCERLHDDAARAPGRPGAAGADGSAASARCERFLTELTLDPPASHQRRGRRAASGRGLPDPVHHPFGQGPGVERRVRAQRGRWLHPVDMATGTPPRSKKSAACSTWR